MKTSTKLGLVAVSLVLIASVLVTAVNAQPADNPYSFHWWYKFQKQQQKQVYDSDDNDDEKDSKKHHNKHISKLDNGYRGERLDKRYCAGSGFWDGKKCVIDDPVERAAYEDAVCDDPKDTDKYSNICGGSYAVEEKPKHKEKEKEDTVITIKPFATSGEKPTIDPEMSAEERKASEEHSFYDEAFDRSNDRSRTDADADGVDDDNSNTIRFDLSDDKPDDNDGSKDGNNDNDDNGNDDNDGDDSDSGEDKGDGADKDESD